MSRSGIITFLTDFGLTDPYSAVMKGAVLSININAKIVDITHQVSAGSISLGAEILREAYSFFPEGTVHVVVIDPGVGSTRKALAVKASGHFFTGPDNGVLWPVIEENPDAEIVELSMKEYFLPDTSSTFHGRDIFAPVAAHISLGTEISRLGPPIKDPEKLILPQPSQGDGNLTGRIIRIDNFGNLITNISKGTLTDFLGGKKPVIHAGGNKISGICGTYSDKDRGKLMALINSSEHLEIAVNLGKASEYIGKAPDDIIGMPVKVSAID